MNNELYHHGVQGMKWGKRNGPPYPLNAEGKASLAKQKKTISKNASDNTEYGSKHYNKELNTATSAARMILSYVPGFSLAILGMKIGSIPFKKAVATGKQKIQDNARAKNENIDVKTGYKIKETEMSEEKDLNHVNPAYQPFKKDSKHNCPNCCVAYDLRRRGFDVRASLAEKGQTEDAIEKLYKNGKFKETVGRSVYNESKSAVDDAIKNMGLKSKYSKSKKEIANDIINTIAINGNSRGIIENRWEHTITGHVVIYEVKNGKMKIMDGQSNTIYDNPADYLTMTDMGSVKYMRTDNLQPNYAEIKKKGLIES